MKYELRMAVDGIEKSAIALEDKPSRVVLTLTSVEENEPTIIELGSRELVVP